jgi:hypothetical protein
MVATSSCYSTSSTIKQKGSEKSIMEKGNLNNHIDSDRNKQKLNEITSHNTREIPKDPKSVESITKNARKNTESNLQQDNKFLSKQLENEQFFNQAKYGEKQCHDAKHYLGLLASAYRNPNDSTLNYGRDLLWTLVKKEAEQNSALKNVLESLPNSSKNNISDEQAIDVTVEGHSQEDLPHYIPNSASDSKRQEIIEPIQEKDHHIISDLEHLKALVDATVTSKQPGSKKFKSQEFLKSIGIEKRRQIVIKDEDHKNWKKYLDGLTMDSSIRQLTYTTLTRYEEKHVNLTRKNNK